MPISDLPILSMLRTKMQWHQDRQRVLAENVANADTPNFRPRDLTPLRYDERRQQVASLSLTRSDPAHLTGGASGSSFELARNASTQVRRTGNAVSLEDEMLKVAANQMDYQTATTLYSKSLGLIKTALGKK